MGQSINKYAIALDLATHNLYLGGRFSEPKILIWVDISQLLDYATTAQYKVTFIALVTASVCFRRTSSF